MALPIGVMGTLALIAQVEAEGFATPPETRVVIDTATAPPSPDAYRADRVAEVAAALGAGDVDAAISAALLASATVGPAYERSRTTILNAAHVLVNAGYPWAGAYTHVAEAFATVGAELEAAVAIADPTTDPDDLTPEQLEAWQQVPALAAELDRLVALLLPLAAMCGRTIEPDDALAMLALCVEADDRPSAYRAWFTPAARGDVWASVARTGARLKAPLSVSEIARWTEASVLS